MADEKEVAALVESALEKHGPELVAQGLAAILREGAEGFISRPDKELSSLQAPGRTDRAKIIREPNLDAPPGEGDPAAEARRLKAKYRRQKSSVDTSGLPDHTDPSEFNKPRVPSELDEEHQRVDGEHQQVDADDDVPAGMPAEIWADVQLLRGLIAGLGESARLAFKRITVALVRAFADALPEISPEELAEIPMYPGRPHASNAWFEGAWAPLMKTRRIWQHHLKEHDERLYNAYRKWLQDRGVSLWQVLPPMPGYADQARRRSR